MYHLVSEQTAELRLSDNVLIGNQTTQYLKPFQLEAVRFLYDRFSKQEFCIFNDESGLGKTASIAAFLSGLNTSKKTLVVLQNDDHLLAGWQFHLGVLTDLSVCVVKDVNDSTESAHSVYLSKWSILRSIGDLSKLKFDYIIVDHRGFTLNNSFCSSMLLKHYEGKVNIVISSVDITSDVKLLYNVLRLGGCLEHQYKTIQAFERKFHLPDVKEVLSKRVDLEEYYKQRGVLGEYIKDYRLRRYRHQFESYLPLVTEEQYKINLSRWLGENNSNSTISQTTLESSSEPLSTGNTDEISECLRNMKREPETTGGNDNAEILSECSDEVVAMEPLFLQLSESEVEDASKDRAETIGDECRSPFIDVVTVSSDDCEIISLPNTPPPHQPTRSPATRKKRKFTKRLQQAENIELTESETEEASPSNSNRKSLNVRLCRVMLPQKKQKETETASKSAEPRKAPLRKPASKKPDEEMTKKPSNEMTTSKSTGVSQSESEKASTSKSKEEQQKTPMKKSPQKVQAVNVVADTSTDQPTTSKATRGRKSESTGPTEHTFKKPQEQKMQSKPTQSTKTVSKTPENESTSSKSTQLRKPATAASKTPTPQAETKSTQVKKPANVTPKKPQEQTKSKTAKEEIAVTKSTQATPKKPPQTTAKKPQTEKTPKSKQTSPKEATEPKTKQAMKTEPANSKKTPQQKKTSADEQMGPLKQERSATPNSEPKTRRSYLRDRNSDDVDQRQTRGMQRLTRSAESRIQSKYMLPLKALEYDKKSPVKGKRSHDAVQTPKASKRKREEDNVKQEETADNRSSTTMIEDEPPPKRKVGRPRKVTQDNQRAATPEVTKKTEITQKVATRESSKQANVPQKVDKQESSKQANITQKVDTPELLSSGSNASDYSYLQCAQKLPDNLTELEAFQDFRIPEVPQATPLMLSSSLNVNFFSDSEVIVVPSSIPKQEVVVINSSNEESSQQSNTQSRRTRALKRKVSKEPSQPSASTSNFGLLLGEQRARVNKSPDIFSNCSDLSQITLAQPVPQPSPFEGFKIFGSEVKQHQVKTQQSIGTQKKRERSCLDILENMFEPHKTKTNKSGINLLPMLPSPKKQLPQRRFTLLDEDIFEITNNGEFGSRLRLNSNGHVSPVLQAQQQQPQATQQLQQRNKITKYLIGSGCTPEDTGQRIQALSPAQRKSPKSIKSTQSTKLTRWFGTADATTSQSAPSTPQVPADKAAAARVARSGGPTKRKQLNLFK